MVRRKGAVQVRFSLRNAYELLRVYLSACTKKNYAGSEKPLPTLFKEKEPLWYRVL